MENWTSFEDSQKIICQRYSADWTPVDLKYMIAVNDSIFTAEEPLNGLRHQQQGTVAGWYLWSGHEIPQDEPDFFKPIHVFHLMDSRPDCLKYLGLPVGFRFQIDRKDHEDVWFDEDMASV